MATHYDGGGYKFDNGKNGTAVVVLDSAGNVIGVGLTGSAPTFATVGAASAEAVAANTARRGLILTNTSGNTISLAFGAAAVLNSGITLSPGAVYTMGPYDFTTAQVRAIASAAGSNLAIQEFV